MIWQKYFKKLEMEKVSLKQTFYSKIQGRILKCQKSNFEKKNNKLFFILKSSRL